MILLFVFLLLFIFIELMFINETSIYKFPNIIYLYLYMKARVIRRQSNVYSNWNTIILKNLSKLKNISLEYMTWGTN